MNELILNAEKSQLMQFTTFISTLKKYKNYIIGYFNNTNTSGSVEGFNNKIKVMKRRFYGIFDENNLFRRLFLIQETMQCTEQYNVAHKMR